MCPGACSFITQYPEVAFGNTWACKLQVAGHTSNCPRRAPYFSPPFSHISPPHWPNLCHLYMNRRQFNKEYHCNKNGAKRRSTWPDTPFWPISLGENQQKGCQKGGKSTFAKYTFQTPGCFGIIKGVLQCVCYGMKRGPGWGVVACNVETQCQHLNWISVQTTGVVLLAPDFMNHLVVSFKHGLHQKSHIPGHLLSWPPLGNYIHTVIYDVHIRLGQPYSFATWSLVVTTNKTPVSLRSIWVGLARTIYIQFIYGIFGREIM